MLINFMRVIINLILMNLNWDKYNMSDWDDSCKLSMLSQLSEVALRRIHLHSFTLFLMALNPLKTYKKFIEDIQESSLSRIKSKSDKGGMATMSASRGDKSAKENRERAKQLDKDIRGRGLPGATKVTGSYVEKDDKTGKETRVKERSHVVTSGKMGKRKFKKTIKALGKKYGQDSVLTQTKKTGTLSATRKGGLGQI